MTLRRGSVTERERMPGVSVVQDLVDTAPALAFLCLGVPYAALLDRLGAFDAFVSWVAARRGSVSFASIWLLSAVVTALLNLDTTIVLLTPITIGLARRCNRDALSVAVIPLLLSGILGALYGWLRTASSPPLAATQRPLTSVASSRPMESARNPAQNPASQQEAAALSTTPAATPIVKPPASQSAPAEAALPTRSPASSPTVRVDARPSPTAPASAPISPSPPKGPAPPPATQEEIDDPEKFLPL